MKGKIKIAIFCQFTIYLTFQMKEKTIYFSFQRKNVNISEILKGFHQTEKNQNGSWGPDRPRISHLWENLFVCFFFKRFQLAFEQFVICRESQGFDGSSSM